MIETDSGSNIDVLRKRLRRESIIGLPGPILVGLGVYGKYSMGEAFHPLLDNDAVTTGMVVAGAIIMASELCASH